MNAEVTENDKIFCYKCKKELELAIHQKVSRAEECPYCYANIHCCKMCRFYDSTAYNDCREPSAVRVVEKEKANYCDYFRLKGGKGNGSQNNDDLLKAANSLFKN